MATSYRWLHKIRTWVSRFSGSHTGVHPVDCGEVTGLALGVTPEGPDSLKAVLDAISRAQHDLSFSQAHLRQLMPSGQHHVSRPPADIEDIIFTAKESKKREPEHDHSSEILITPVATQTNTSSGSFPLDDILITPRG